MKEKTLNKKMMTPYEAVRKFEEEWDNNNPELKCVLDSEDVRQFIKEILDLLDEIKPYRWECGRLGCSGVFSYEVHSCPICQSNEIREIIQINKKELEETIKQKSGFEELE